MKAIRKVAPRPNGLELMEIPVPRCGPGEILVRVRAASLCGTDAHIYNWDGSVPGKILAATDQLTRPLTIGHEFCGDVVEIGREVRGVGQDAAEPIRPGDLISAESHIVCGACYQCRRGEFHVCARARILGVQRDGGFAEYVALPAGCVWKNDPDIVPVEVACIEEPLGNAVHASTAFEVRERCVAVFGAGPIGLFSILVAGACGAARVIAVDTTPFRLELASRVGAHTVIRTEPPAGGPEATARERERIVGLIRDAAAPWEVDVAMEMSGHPDALDAALRAVRRGGGVVLFGLPRREPVILQRYAEDVIFGGITLRGIIGRRLYGTWAQTRELVSRPEVRDKIRVVITHEFPLTRFEEAFRRMIDRDSGKIILQVAGDGAGRSAPQAGVLR
jgi:threonine 3-dehydrogenase